MWRTNVLPSGSRLRPRESSGECGRGANRLRGPKVDRWGNDSSRGRNGCSARSRRTGVCPRRKAGCRFDARRGCGPVHRVRCLRRNGRGSRTPRGSKTFLTRCISSTSSFAGPQRDSPRFNSAGHPPPWLRCRARSRRSPNCLEELRYGGGERTQRRASGLARQKREYTRPVAAQEQGWLDRVAPRDAERLRSERWHCRGQSRDANQHGFGRTLRHIAGKFAARARAIFPDLTIRER